jgi:hypothetical protein
MNRSLVLFLHFGFDHMPSCISFYFLYWYHSCNLSHGDTKKFRWWFCYLVGSMSRRSSLGWFTVWSTPRLCSLFLSLVRLCSLELRCAKRYTPPLRTFTQYLQSTGNVSVEIRHYAELLYSQVLLLWQLTRIPSVSISKEWNSIIMLDFAVLESWAKKKKTRKKRKK